MKLELALAHVRSMKASLDCARWNLRHGHHEEAVAALARLDEQILDLEGMARRVADKATETIRDAIRRWLAR